MNGDTFFFFEKQVSFSKQNLVVLYALSTSPEELAEKHKWPDFLSRIPFEHQFVLPTFDSHFERLFRAVGILARGPLSISTVSCQALLFLSLHSWKSSREMDQALELAKVRLRDSAGTLQVEDVVTSLEDIEIISREQKVDIFGREDRIIKICR
jgi:hypothetical protein